MNIEQKILKAEPQGDRLQRWRLVDTNCHGKGQEVFAEHIRSEETARRMLACWNACEGLSTESLAHVLMFGDTLASRFKARDEVEVERITKQRDELLRIANDAATSLETICFRSFGEESYLDSKHDMRAYAGSRAMVAREEIAKAEAQS